MKNVMTKAWEIARQGAAKFGGSVKSYFAEALKLAWAMFKKAATTVKSAAESTEELKARFVGLLEQLLKNKETRKMLADNYEMALMHGQKAKADAQLAHYKKEEEAIKAEIQKIRVLAGGQEVLSAWAKEAGAARKKA